jgi:hypothetical protein
VNGIYLHTPQRTKLFIRSYFDGARCHLDYRIVEAAEPHEITLFCLPSNCTHELQPLDKAVYRSFEHHWDLEVLKFWDLHSDRAITKPRFNKIFSKVWPLCTSPVNIQSGFRSTGIYPFDPDAIPEEAFDPSTLTRRSQDIGQTIRRENATTHVNVSISDDDSEDDVPLQVLIDNSKMSTTKPTENLKLAEDQTSFHELMLTPEAKIKQTHTNRKKAINYQAQKVTKDLFNDYARPSTSRETHSKSSAVPKNKNRGKSNKESWYCPLCDTFKDVFYRLLSHLHKILAMVLFLWTIMLVQIEQES